MRFSKGDINRRFLGYPSLKTRQEILKRLTETCTIVVSSEQPSGGQVFGGGTYRYGETVTIKATPAPFWNFLKWNDGNTNPTRQLTVRRDMEYVAYFTRQTGKVIFKHNH